MPVSTMSFFEIAPQLRASRKKLSKPWPSTAQPAPLRGRVGYRTDAVVLRRLLGHHYRYLGVLGSATKVAELRRLLTEEGFSAADLARLRGPIGVPISSRTPEEIAVSVAAELIAVRNAR